MSVYVYELIDPVTDAVVYVGQSDHPSERYAEHLEGEYAETAAMIADMQAWRRLPVMRIVGEYDSWTAATAASASIPCQAWRIFPGANPMVAAATWL